MCAIDERGDERRPRASTTLRQSWSKRPLAPASRRMRDVARALDEPLDRPEDALEEHRLRARPAAPHATEQRRDVDERRSPTPLSRKKSSHASCALNVAPKRKNCRCSTSRNTAGCPPIVHPRQRRPQRDEQRRTRCVRARVEATRARRPGRTVVAGEPSARGRALQDAVGLEERARCMSSRTSRVSVGLRVRPAGPCRRRRWCPCSVST